MRALGWKVFRQLIRPFTIRLDTGMPPHLCSNAAQFFVAAMTMAPFVFSVGVEGEGITF